MGNCHLSARWYKPVYPDAGWRRGSSKEQRRSAAKEAATACSDGWRLAELQQGSTLQLLPYYPVVGEEAEKKMRYAI